MHLFLVASLSANMIGFRTPPPGACGKRFCKKAANARAAAAHGLALKEWLEAMKVEHIM